MRTVALASLAVLTLSGCTAVTADINSGIVSVYTFATARQDIDIAREADGSVHWRAKSSSPDSDIAAAALNATAVAAKVVGAPVR